MLSHLPYFVLMAALVLLPGLALLANVRHSLLNDVWMRLALAVPASVLIASAVAIIVLAAGGTIRLLAAGVALVTVVAAATALVRWRGRGRRQWRAAADPDVISESRLEWLVRHAASLVLVLIGMVSGRWIGTAFSSDSSFHAGVIEKFIHLPHLRWSTLGMFKDADLHPAYMVPGWHALLSIAAWLSGLNGAQAMYGASTAAMGLLVIGWLAAGRVLFASRWGGVACAATFLIVQIFAASVPMIYIKVSAYPGTIADSLILPVWIAIVVSLARDPQLRTRGTQALAALCLVAIVVLHANYVFYPLIVGLALLLGCLLAGRARPAGALSALVRTALVQGAIALIAVLALVPFLRRLDQFGRGTGEDTTSNLFDQWGPVLSGHAGNFHLRWEYFSYLGGAAMGLLVLAGVIWALRRGDPAAWFMGGTTLLLLVVMHQGWLFAHLNGLGSMPVLARSSRLLPVVPIGGFVVLWLATRARMATLWLVAAAVVGGLLAWLAAVWPNALAGRDQPSVGLDAAGAGWIIAALIIVALAALMNLVRALRERRAGRTDDLPARTVHAPISGSLRQGHALIALAAVVLIALPPTIAVAQQVRHDTPDIDVMRKEDARLSTNVAGLTNPSYASLAGLKPGQVLLAQGRLSYQLMTVAPVYAVAVNKLGLASTEGASNKDRLALVERFYSGDMSDDERFDVIKDEHVDVIAAGAFDKPTIAFIERHPDRFQTRFERGRLVRLWCVDSCDAR